MTTGPGPELPPPPTLDRIAAARRRLAGTVLETPVWRWRGETADRAFGPDAEAWLKLELWQHGGSFKVRGALLNVLALDAAALARGVTTVSAGNHAIALAWAARARGTSAKVVMPATADPGRVARCRRLGAEVVLVADVHEAFAAAERIEREEGRTFVHPFEGETTVLGQATLGHELSEQLPGLDAVVVPIGGGGLCAGVATAIKGAQPGCAVYGVEPAGADSMHRSFAAGGPRGIDAVTTIADSLGAPYALPYSYALCRQFVDELCLVDDDALRAAMRLLFDELKLAVEPAGAASTAAALGPLRERLSGRRFALVLCGANTDVATFARHAGAPGG